MSKFDAEAEVAKLEQRLKVRAKSRRYKSKLDKYKHELLALRRAGGSLGALQLHLADRKVKVDRSTISRWLTKHGAAQQS